MLSLAGWEILPQDPPVYPVLIQEPEGSGSILKNTISSDGCCGEAELIKLSTYKLLDHSIAVHLDLDTLVIQPLDELFDVMHFDVATEEGRAARVRLGAAAVAPTYVNRRNTGDPSSRGLATARELLANMTVDAFFTKDYNMIPPGTGKEQRVGVQGGFLVLRPSSDTYARLLSIVYSGEFYGGFEARNTGWLRR